MGVGLVALAGVVVGFVLSRRRDARLDAELFRLTPPAGHGICNIAPPTTAELD